MDDKLMRLVIPHIRQALGHIGASYSLLYFMQGRIIGLCVLLITWLSPYTASMGLLSVGCAYAMARFFSAHTTFMASSALVYNTLMAGMGVTVFYPHLAPLAIFFAVMVGIISFFITISLEHTFKTFLGLPVLSLPFVLVSLFLFSVVQRLPITAAALPPSILHIEPTHAPYWLAGFFKALGAIVYAPKELVGALIAVLLLVHSRILFGLAFGGYLLGTLCMGLFTGSMQAAFADYIGFNYLLVAMALGAGFNIPHLKSYLMAAAGVVCTVLFVLAFKGYFPLFTLPFVVVTLVFLYVSRYLLYTYQPLVVKSTPEQTLEYFLVARTRYSPTPATLSLPYYGTWHVWQGFDGDWTHQGASKYAYDFVIKDALGSTFNTLSSQGKLLSDYYCFKQPVLSPVRGRVIQVVHYLEDHPIGSVNTTHHYGNYVLIHDVRGYFVKIAHFAQYTIDVMEGSWVEVGTRLGLCGNSGYSPQPHIHIHIQTTAFGATETLPFRFLNYIENHPDQQRYVEQGLPALTCAISQAPPLPYYTQLTTFLLDAAWTFDVIDTRTQKTTQVTLAVNMAADHSLYFENTQNPNSKLYFGHSEGSFYCYHLEGNDPVLRMVYLALPTMPLYYQPLLAWTDTLATHVVFTAWRKALATWLNSFVPRVAQVHATYHFAQPNVIKGVIRSRLQAAPLNTQITLNPFYKIDEISVGHTVLKRISA